MPPTVEHPRHDRVALVLVEDEPSGSGYLMDRQHVLTVAHVVGEVDVVGIRMVGDDDVLEATVAWRGKGPYDMALLRLTEPLGDDRGPDPTWASCGSSDSPCDALGHPVVQDEVEPEAADGHEESDPGPGFELGRIDGFYASGSRPGKDWAGASGAALFVRGAFVGVVTHGDVDRLLARSAFPSKTHTQRADLARSLDDLGKRLHDQGRREQALRATEEAVDLWRGLARRRPEAFLPDLASSLLDLGNCASVSVHDQGRREQALRATKEAVDIHRRLAQQRPEAFLPDLASSLHDLGGRSRVLQRHEEALRATEEAVDIHRRLAQTRPEAFLPDLASTLHDLGGHLSAVHRHEEALRATEEAVDIQRRLAQQRPEAFLPDLAWFLHGLGQRLRHLDRREDALRAHEEAVDVSRDLAGRRPFQSLLFATSFLDLGKVHIVSGRHVDAVGSFAEGLRLILPLQFSGKRSLVSIFARDLRLAAQRGGLPIPEDLAPVIAKIWPS